MKILLVRRQYTGVSLIPDFKIGKILGCGGEKYIDNLIEQFDQNGFFLDLSKPEENCSGQNNDQVSNQQMLEFMAGGPKTRRYQWKAY